jgi:hypothetical protein
MSSRFIATSLEGSSVTGACSLTRLMAIILPSPVAVSRKYFWRLERTVFVRRVGFYRRG